MLSSKGVEELVCDVQTRRGKKGKKRKCLEGSYHRTRPPSPRERVAAGKPDGDKIRNPPQRDVPSS